jgi:hypothetical protein
MSLLKGKSSHTVADLKTESLVTFFRPAMLASASLKAQEAINAFVKNHFGKATDHIPEVWSEVFRRLWAIGHDWTKRGFNDNGVDLHFSQKSFKLQRHLHLGVWGTNEGESLVLWTGNEETPETEWNQEDEEEKEESEAAEDTMQERGSARVVHKKSQ